MRKHDEHQPDKEKKKHPILFTFLALILILALFVTINANRNIKAMNDCVDETLKTLRSSYTMTPVDVGDYEEMNIYGIMKFHVEQYDIEGLGNLSVMRMNMGLMQMATVVITPQDKNMPLLSADYMYILSNRQSYLEFYDVVSEKNDLYLELLDSLDKHLDQYAHLENIETSPA
ncbi:MAG: hypothetical protein IJ327_01685 [Lachnospiraceae bacterium]|nr:hypothetical protein [Lachnospiraceae bacterium]